MLDQLPQQWRAAPRRWGHPLHSLCSYMAMFPPAIPRTFIEWLTKPGDVVYDPFSGRGTTALQACLQGRVGYGSDANPLAVALSAAKVDPPSRAQLTRRIAALRASIKPLDTRGQPEHIRMLFTPGVLGELLWLRWHLRPQNKTDRFITATLLGVLHAGADNSGRPRGLTVSMPNTFSMAPRYVARYIRDHGLTPPSVRVLDVLERRIASLELERLPSTGSAWMQDATCPPHSVLTKSPARLVFTSPPYLQVIKYGKFNWIRLWFLGHEPKDVDGELFSSGSLPKYLKFMAQVLVSIRSAMRDDGYACLVIGDVRRGDEDLNLAQAVADSSVDAAGLHALGVVTDKLPAHHKVSRIWKENRGRATKTDRLLLLSASRKVLPSFTKQLAWS